MVALFTGGLALNVNEEKVLRSSEGLNELNSIMKPVAVWESL